MNRMIALLSILVCVLGLVTGCSNATTSAGDGAPFITVKEVRGYQEAASVTFEGNRDSYEIYIKGESSSEYTKVDGELLIRDEYGFRAVVPGLKPGNYTFRIVNGDSSFDTEQVEVTAYDRSGYAHFKNEEGVGAYNDDGTLKENAEVVYVNNGNKNTVALDIGGETFTGLAGILKNADKCTVPLDIRIIGKIDTVAWNKVGYKNMPNTPELLREQKEHMQNLTDENIPESVIVEKGINSYDDDLAKGITKLEGLDTSVTYDDKKGEYDCCWNELNLHGLSDVTIEGIGKDAAIEKWGFSFSDSRSIEVRNLSFSGYNDDAINVTGTDMSNPASHNFFFHHLHFQAGSNPWDLSLEQDKPDGDGSIDFAKSRNMTIAYCHFDHTRKTGLIGGGNDVRQYNVTLHHNIYDGCLERMPLLRQANCHIYNNLYKNVGHYCMSVRACAFAFVEKCCFLDSKNPMMLAYKTSNGVDPTGTAVKAIDNVFQDITLEDDESFGMALGKNGIYVLTGIDDGKAYSSDLEATRLTRAEGSICTPADGLNLSNFDTNPEAFYFDESQGISDVERMDDPKTLPEILPGLVGPVG